MGWRQDAKQSDARRAGVGRDSETFRDRQKRLGKPQTEDVKNPYKAYDSEKLQRLKKNMRDNVANLTQRIRKRAGNASQSLKDELKDLERKSKLIDLALKDVNQRKQDQKDKIQLARSYAKPGSSFHSKYRGAGMGEELDEGMIDTLKQRVQQAKDALQKYRDSEAAQKVRDQHRARVEKGRKILDAPNLRKKLGRESVEEAINDSAKESIRKRIETMQDEQDRLDKIVQEKQEEKKRIRQQNVDNNTKNIAYKKIDRLIDQLENRHRRIQIEKELLRDKLSESVQLNELKVSFKFDKLADAAKAERKAMQMKKLNVDSEKVQGKMMWLLHVSGKYTDIMKYIKRVDLEDKVHESKEMSLDDIKKRYAREIIAFQNDGKDLSSGAKMALYGYIGSDGLKTDDADEFDDFVMGLQMGKYKKESLDEGSESWEDGYKRRVVRTTKPEHKEKGYNWRIKGKDKAHLTIKLYKDKPSQAEFNKQMKRVAGHEFGG